MTDIAIRVSNLSKCYHLYNTPRDRLKQFLWRGRRQYFREFWALRDVSFDVMPGEVVGIIGRNGSGKSTLLQLICGTLTPSAGGVAVKGRVAALLELGAGFNPEFTGRENVFMSAAIMGLSEDEISARYEDIVEFSGIRDFLDQPVKTYSSGMYVRLAFSVAISVDPDILVIDEALSVGDGEFSRKSFDRIMALKNAGKTILFCSHSTYHIQAICNWCLWLDHGVLRKLGESGEVLTAYANYLESEISEGAPGADAGKEIDLPPDFTARITEIKMACNGRIGASLLLKNNEDDFSIHVEFRSSSNLPIPSIGVGIRTPDGRVVCSAGSFNDGVALKRDSRGVSNVVLEFPKLPLLKGEYLVDVYLMCENGIHIYEQVRPCGEIIVRQRGLEQGLVTLQHSWQQK
jgi:lipopolysaccharide transport system ATP-binding protein